MRTNIKMNKRYEYQDSVGRWKQLFVLNWEEAVERSKEFGYSVREVLTEVINKTYIPGKDIL
jgi:hypothetical protein